MYTMDVHDKALQSQGAQTTLDHNQRVVSPTREGYCMHSTLALNSPEPTRAGLDQPGDPATSA